LTSASAIGNHTARTIFITALALWACSATAESALADKHQVFGAAVAPSTLPEGAASAYVYGGVQELATGYRQGLGSVEIEARAKFNYFLISVAFEVLLKHTVTADEPIALAPFLGIGLVHDTGSRYITSVNFQHTGVRALAGLIGTHRLNDVTAVVAELDLPLDLAFSPPTGVWFAPLAGGGFELYLGSDVSALLMGQLGVTFAREPLGVPQWALGYQVKAGFGFRLF
jgi:hypothetical protein